MLCIPPIRKSLFFGTYRVWKTTNRGNNWTAISGDLTHSMANSGFSTITTLAISKLNPNRLLAGSDDGRVHITNNGGLNWVDISEGLPVRWITRVAFDPFDENTIYATVSGFRWDEPHPYVFRSQDLGQDWEAISGNLPELPVNVIVADPGVQNRLFVGTDAGIFYTENGGDHWWGLSQGIPNVPVTDLKIHHPTRSIVAGTYGCSAYRLNLDLLTLIDKPEFTESGSGVLMKAVFPNPFNQSAVNTLNLTCYFPVNTTGEFTVFDINGRVVRKLYSGQTGSGAFNLQWDGKGSSGENLANGIYLIRIVTPVGSDEQKVMLMN
jgi:hypothetical protein